jgi:hypothetical protein
MRVTARIVPILVFAAALAVFERLATGCVSALPFVTVGVFLATAIVAKLVPWRRIVERSDPGSRGFTLLLFLLMVRHFAAIFAAEARRVLVARKLCLARRYGPGWSASLVWALAGVFRRSLARAERFYAGLVVNRWAE